MQDHTTFEDRRPSAGVVDPNRDELLFHVVVTFDGFAFEIHLLQFALGAGEHLDVEIGKKLSAAHDWLAHHNAVGFDRRFVRSH